MNPDAEKALSTIGDALERDRRITAEILDPAPTRALRRLANANLERAHQAEELVRWLALSWADNNPRFPPVDPVTGQPLPGNARLAATWYRIVRGTEPEPDTWGQLDPSTEVVHATYDPSTGGTRESKGPASGSPATTER